MSFLRSLAILLTLIISNKVLAEARCANNMKERLEFMREFVRASKAQKLNVRLNKDSGSETQKRVREKKEDEEKLAAKLPAALLLADPARGVAAQELARSENTLVADIASSAHQSWADRWKVSAQTSRRGEALLNCVQFKRASATKENANKLVLSEKPDRPPKFVEFENKVYDIANLKNTEMPTGLQQKLGLTTAPRQTFQNIRAEVIKGDRLDDAAIERLAALEHDQWLARNADRATQAQALRYDEMVQRARELPPSSAIRSNILEQMELDRMQVKSALDAIENRGIVIRSSTYKSAVSSVAAATAERRLAAKALRLSASLGFKAAGAALGFVGVLADATAAGDCKDEHFFTPYGSQARTPSGDIVAQDFAANHANTELGQTCNYKLEADDRVAAFLSKPWEEQKYILNAGQVTQSGGRTRLCQYYDDLFAVMNKQTPKLIHMDCPVNGVFNDGATLRIKAADGRETQYTIKSKDGKLKEIVMDPPLAKVTYVDGVPQDVTAYNGNQRLMRMELSDDKLTTSKNGNIVRFVEFQRVLALNPVLPCSADGQYQAPAEDDGRR